jgi:hypothetical protein
VSNSGFVYPIVLILVGFFVFNLLGYYEHYKKLGKPDPHLSGSFTFMFGAFSVGFLTLITPKLYLEYQNASTDYCLSDKTNVVPVTLTTSLILSFLLLLVFKLTYTKGDEHFWFSLKSQYWWPSLVISGALVVY